jgi:hypothetical protein
MLKAIGIVSISAVGGTPGWLHIGYIPGFGTKDAEKRGRVEGTGSHFQVISLYNYTVAFRPVFVQIGDYILEMHKKFPLYSLFL